MGEEGALRPGANIVARPSHCAGVASVTASRSGFGKSFGGTMKQHGLEPKPVMKSMSGTDPMSRLDIGRISDLAGASVVVAAESHDVIPGPQSRTLTVDVVSLARVKVPVALPLADAFPQPDVEPAKTTISSDAPQPRT